MARTGFLTTKGSPSSVFESPFTMGAGHRSEWTHSDDHGILTSGHKGLDRHRLTPKHSETGSYLSIFMSNTYTEPGENANVVLFRPWIRLQFSRSPWEDIRILRHVRIYIIMERKERFPSSTDCFPLRPRYFICSLLFFILLPFLLPIEFILLVAVAPVCIFSWRWPGLYFSWLAIRIDDPWRVFVLIILIDVMACGLRLWSFCGDYFRVIGWKRSFNEAGSEWGRVRVVWRNNSIKFLFSIVEWWIRSG